MELRERGKVANSLYKNWLTITKNSKNLKLSESFDQGYGYIANALCFKREQRGGFNFILFFILIRFKIFKNVSTFIYENCIQTKSILDIKQSRI
jgi:hypothetical protein